VADNNTLQERLSTWKEIAVYLDCDVRTCQRWERKLALPVHRFDPDSSKTRVFAYKSELDEWLKKDLRTKSFRINIRRKKAKYFFLIIPAALLFLLVILNINPGSSVPFNFDIKDSRLLILNEKSSKLWSFDTGLSNLCSEEIYRKHFQEKRRNDLGVVRLPHLMIKDLDGDEKKEVLFTTQTRDERKEGLLICLDHKGKKLWEFKSGKVLKFGTVLYSSDYRIKGMDVYDINGNGSMEIIVISRNRYFFPSQLVLLNSKGELLGEFWNSGALTDYYFVDLNRDKEVEFIVSGTNNEYNTGCLMVFDPADIWGASPQSGEYLCQELKQGSEKYYIVIPPTDVENCISLRNVIDDVEIFNNQIISAKSINGQIYYELNFDLKLINVNYSDQFEKMHRKLFSENKITSELNQDYKARLMQGLLYYDGQKWVSNPTAVQPTSPTPAR
jgi:hypothetical protein